jgi:pimeloyl-ACP methyl ester carboxylesterase
MRWLIGIVVTILAVLGLGYWYLSAPDIPRSVLEAKYATPPSRFTDITYASTLPGGAPGTAPNAAHVHFRIRGAAGAPVLLLLHGSNATLFTWEPWSKALSDHFRVVSVDLPAHGLTGPTANHDYTQAGMANFVLAFADKLGLKTFALAGNSMGGGVAAYFAEEHPARVSKLILVDAAGLPFKASEGTPLAFRLARIPVLNLVLLHVTPRAIVTEGLDKAIVHKSIINDAMIDWYWDFARMEGTRRATMERFQLPFDTYAADHSAALKMPTLILWGEQDRLIPVSVAHDWHKAVPGSTLIVYPATGHIPMEEVADQSAADVRKFLGGS